MWHTAAGRAATLEVAKAIYHAAFDPARSKPEVPSPGWCWEKASLQQQEFCIAQAIAAMEVLAKAGWAPPSLEIPRPA